MTNEFLEFGAIEDCDCEICSCGNEEVLAMSKELCTNCECNKET